MRIDLNAGQATGESSLEKSASARPSATAAQAGAEPGSSVEEPKFTSLSATVLAAPEVRGQKVAALQAELASGSYRVSSSQIAASLLEAMRVNG